MGVDERSSVTVMGFNSPQWFMAYMGAICNNNVGTGMYATNSPEACLYQINHSESQVVVCSINDWIQKVILNLDKMPQINAVILWGEKELPENVRGDKRFFLWKDFLEMG